MILEKRQLFLLPAACPVGGLIKCLAQSIHGLYTENNEFETMTLWGRLCKLV